MLPTPRGRRATVALCLVLCCLGLATAGVVAADAGAAAGTGVDADAATDWTDSTAADERVELAGNVSVWDRAFLPLRADADAAATAVPAPRVFVDAPSAPEGDLNRDWIAAYDPGTVPVTFSRTSGADVSQFAGEQVQVLVFRTGADEPGGQSVDAGGHVPAADVAAVSQDEVSDGRDHAGLAAQSVAPVVDALEPGPSPVSLDDVLAGDWTDGSAPVEASVTTATLDPEDGTLEYELDADEPGQYLVAVVTGSPFAVEDGDLRTTGEPGTVIGVESVLVHDRRATVDAPASVTAGESATFDVDTELPGAPVRHAVVLYDEAALLDAETTLSVDEAALTVPSPETVALEHSIGSIAGDVRVAGDGPLEGTTHVSGVAERVRGSTDLRELLAAVEAEYDLSMPNRITLGDEQLDASATVVAGGADATVEVGTLANATPGTYRYVHVATDRSAARSFETRTGTVEVRAPETGGEPADGSPDDGSTGSASESTLCPPTLGFSLPEPSLTLSGPSVDSSRQPLRADAVPEGVRVCGSLGTDVGDTGVGFTSFMLTTSRETDVDATVHRTETPPPDVDPVPTDAGELAYLRVEHDDLASAAEDVELTARVDLDRLAAANRTLEDLAFAGYVDGEWTVLDHRVAKAGQGRATVVVESPGFSPVAAAFRDAEVGQAGTPFAPGAEASVVRVSSASLRTGPTAAGEPVEVAARVTADPPSAQEHVARLAVDGEVVAQKAVTVGDDGTAMVTFEHPIDEPGMYTLSVDDVPAGTVTVQERATVVDTTDDEGLGATLALLLALLGLLALGGGYLFWRVALEESPVDPL